MLKKQLGNMKEKVVYKRKIFIENFRKIKNQYFNEWQVAKAMYDSDVGYFFEFHHKTYDKKYVVFLSNEIKLKENGNEYCEIGVSNLNIKNDSHEEFIYIDNLSSMNEFGYAVAEYLKSL